MKHGLLFAPLLLALLLAPPGGAGTAMAAETGGEAAIPQPAELEPDIRFWMRVYSEVSTNEGYIHDQRNLAVVYETLHFAGDLPPRQRAQQVDAAREHYQAILRHLGSGVPAESDEERRVQGLWGDADAPRLAQAADDVRFQLGQSDRFRAGLARAGTWESHIAQSLSALGLPPEIAVLPHVESSFQPEAMSKAGAAGLWQFIRSTGRRFLRIDRAVDERLDPYRSTEAAAQLLAYNYRVLGTWPLAITAYNHGAAGMRRAREQLGTDDIVKIVRYYHSPSFGFASRNYYASFLAALRLDREPEKYFGAVQRRPDTASQELALPVAARIDALAHVLGVDTATLRELNPALRPAVWNRQQPVPRGYRLRVPEGRSDWTASLLAARLAVPPPAVAALAANATPSAAATAMAAARNPGHGAAGKPAPTGAPPVLVAATAPAPASAAPAGAAHPSSAAGATPAVAAAPVVAAVPAVRAVPAAPVVAAPPAAEPAAESSPGSYVVRRGDSLATIATQAGLDPEVLMRINALRDDDHIYEGQTLTLIDSSAASAQAVTLATEEDRQDASQAAAAAAAVRGSPALTAAQASAQGPTLVADDGAPASADPIDYSVRADNTLVVVAAETIGHYADWLGLPTSVLRRLNDMQKRSTVLMGRRIRLDFSRVSREQFEQRRRDYHQQLQTAYFATHRIVGSDSYVARRGDSLWSVTQRGSLPVWLLQQYNPDVDFAELRPGTQIVLPKVEDVS